MLAAALAVVAIAAAITGMAREIASLGLIAAAISAVLAAAVVWLNGSVSAISDALQEARLENTRLASSASAQSAQTKPTVDPDLTERVTQQITGQVPTTSRAQSDPTNESGGSDPIVTPAGELSGLDLGNTADLADPDTGLLGERYFVVTLEARVAAARRHLRPLALVLIEAVSDASASASPVDPNLAADVVRETLRDADTLCRLQSGQFAVLLEDTPENGAIWTVERIRRRLGEHLDDVTVWAGIACYPANGFDGPEVLDRAREALVQAREWRQDRTEVADT